MEKKKVGSRKCGKMSAIYFYPSCTNVTKPRLNFSPGQGLRAPAFRVGPRKGSNFALAGPVERVAR